MGKMFENLTWDDLCGAPEDDYEKLREKYIPKIRQDKSIRVNERCFKPTYYPIDGAKAYKQPACIYLTKEGKCELNYCVRGAT